MKYHKEIFFDKCSWKNFPNVEHHYLRRLKPILFFKKTALREEQIKSIPATKNPQDAQNQKYNAHNMPYAIEFHVL